MVAEATYVGVHVGDFYGLPATGRSIEIRLAVVITFKDGLMLGERFYYDTGALLSQLGVFAPTTAALPALAPNRVGEASPASEERQVC